MTRVAAGDRDAFGELVDRHHGRALNLAYRLSGDADMAQDVAQETFLRLLGAAGRYEPRARFTTFLFTIVRNLSIELARRRARRGELPLEAQERTRGGATDAADAAVARAEIRELIEAGLRALPDRLRAVYVLSEIEEMSYAEIARICGCPVGTVGSRKHEAVVRLRAFLDRRLR